MKLLLLYFVAHFVADFLLQPRKMGKLKSEKPLWLLGHLAIQFAVFYPFAGWKFALANAAIHGVIDWNIWRLYKLKVYYQLRAVCRIEVEKTCQSRFEDYRVVGAELVKQKIIQYSELWEYWNDHWFYATIGLDQLLHAVTLILLATYL